jgi:hypothetical protein
MTKDDLNKLIATYIVAIGPAGAPNSHVWMAVDQNMDDLDKHNKVLGWLIESDLAKNQFHFLTLTRKGMELHNKLVAIYAPELAKPPVTT